jgi:alpha-glucosidase
LPAHGWPNWVLGNHDKPRIMARVGSAQARVAAMLLLTLRGTPTMYYGDEIGMAAVQIPPQSVQDPWEKNVPGRGLGRDPSRTPMQWDRSSQAGFTTGRPWLPLSADYRTINVEVERTQPTSLLTFYRRLLSLRRTEPAFSLGHYRRVEATEHAFLYIREANHNRWLIALNFSAQPIAVSSSTLQGRVTLSTMLDREGDSFDHRIGLRPNEGIVARLAGSSGPSDRRMHG